MQKTKVDHRKSEFSDGLRGVIYKISAKFYRHKLRVLGLKTGIEIPINTFGKGLGLFHYGSKIVNGTSHFGDYCVIQSGVVISKGVVGGDYIYIAPGVKIGDNVKIADNVILGMNAVVTKDILEVGTTWGGVPAKKISEKGFYRENKYRS